ncbi:hypothetical protein RBA41_02240 [Massilia sp. CCM 9210]|uniref:hypothetical protein n=1 Tax=Massilia scottii TaxID=3057166 RepID=UPI0027966E4E|nr:hypothetical protein [Massilia sp. CCM 9210]MDQ1812113.1 hypothetical protein [Massilia sp. CCM 9210]
MIALDALLAQFNTAFGLKASSFTAFIEHLGPPGRWQRLDRPENMGDLEIVGLVDQSFFLPEQLYVVTEESYCRKVGAFAVHRDDLRDFVGAYRERHGVMMFNGDTLIVGIGSKAVWIFHHEGVWTLFDG